GLSGGRACSRYPVFFVCHVAGPTRLAMFVLRPKDPQMDCHPSSESFEGRIRFRADADGERFITGHVACAGCGAAARNVSVMGLRALEHGRLDNLADLCRLGHHRLVPAVMATWWRQATFCPSQAMRGISAVYFVTNTLNYRMSDIIGAIYQEAVRRFWRRF